MFFKKKEKCFHKWTLVDYVNDVDASLAINEYYLLGCQSCKETRYVEPYDFDRMKHLGLIS